METMVLDVPAYRVGDTPSAVTQPIQIPKELKVLEGKDQPQPGCGVFRLLTQKDGDKRVTWDKGSLAEIKAAKKLFLDLIKQGMIPYNVGVNGQRSSRVMREFDAAAEEIIFLPVNMVQGG
jgi:hypothetical protein